MFTPETQAQIADVARWMEMTKVPPGTLAGHARSAVRAILGLYRLTGGDPERVQEILAEHVAQAWYFTGCEQVAGTGMTPIFTVAEVPDAVSAVQEMHEISI